MEKTKNRIRFRDLSLPMKLAAIGGMIFFIDIILAFISGFMYGLGV